MQESKLHWTVALIFTVIASNLFPHFSGIRTKIYFIVTVFSHEIMFAVEGLQFERDSTVTMAV